MKIKDNPDFKTKSKPVTFSPEDTVRSALNVMCEKNIGSIIVVNSEQKIAGIVTERDMMIRVLGQDINPDKVTLAEIMSTNIRAASEEDNLVDWIHIMSSERFRHLPVVDADGKLVNMMSQGDFVAHTFPDLYEAIRQDLKGRLGRGFQFGLILFAILTLGLIALNL
ncbi:MAG: CBS domain-containing protein [Pseudomonadota bacterium]